MAWHSGLQDGDGWGVYGQAFDAASAKSGSEFRLSTTTSGNQYRPVLAADSDGRFIAAWESPDADGSGIVTRRIIKPIE